MCQEINNIWRHHAARARSYSCFAGREPPDSGRNAGHRAGNRRPDGRADAYPDHPIRLVVPYAAGGAVDIVARSVGQRMSQLLKQPVIVDNRPGASTNIGMDFVAKAPADGYTIMMASNSLATNAALFNKLSFNPATDFAPVARLARHRWWSSCRPSRASRR
jgi:tripartite-type tricarboxylate transporter receptor subunit TctC